MTTLFTNALHTSLTTGVVIVLILLLSGFINRRFVAKWKYWVWLILAARLLVPVPLSLPQAPVQISVPATTVTRPNPAPPSTQVVTDAPTAVWQEIPENPTQTTGSNITLLEALCLVWLAGIAIFLAYHAVSYLRCKRHCLRWSLPGRGGEAIRLLTELCQEMAIRKPPTLLISEAVSGPMMIGLFHGYLLLPTTDYNPDDLAFILRHELVHYRRRDIWYKLFLLLANAVHWFNPAAWLLFREAAKDLELACDDEVVRGLAFAERKCYSETILRAVHRQRQAALSTYFRGGTKTLRERFANILGKNKKRNGLLLGGVVLVCAAVVGGLVAVNSSTELPTAEYEALYEKYLASLHVSMIANSSWDNPNQVTPDYFIEYFADEFIREGNEPGQYFDGENWYLPQEVLEPFVQRHFDVSTEHLRAAERYSTEHSGYDFGGMGSAVSFFVTSAIQRGNTLILAYDVTGGSGTGYLLADGVIEIENPDQEDYKYRSNRYKWSAEYSLVYPSSFDIASENGVLVMESGGRSGTSSDGENWTYYDGEDLQSIISFYLEEALPKLGAEGAPNAEQPADGWRWSGTYWDDVPLTIDVEKRFGASTYLITIVHKADAGATFTPVGNLDLTDLDELYSDYVGQMFFSGALDSSWTVPFNANSASLVRFYALRVKHSEDESSFPAEEVDAFLSKYFLDYTPDIIRYSICYDAATDTYNTGTFPYADYETDCHVVNSSRTGDTLVLAYEVYSAQDETEQALWEGELTIQLSAEGYQYTSNVKRFPLVSTTQNVAELEEIQETYLAPLLPHTLLQDWASPEDIPADQLVEFAAYNNLLNKPVLPDNQGISRGAELADQYGAALELEAAVQLYFDVSNTHLRSSRWYEYADDPSDETYANAYLLINGTGGPGKLRSYHAEREGDLLHITVGICGPEDDPDRPMKLTLLTVQIGEGGGFRYLSNTELSR